MSKTTKKCIGKKQNGQKCTYKVSTNCGSLFCNKHVNSWRIYGKEKTHKLCGSRLQCYINPEKKGLKKILLISYEFDHCDRCREHDRIKSKERRDNINKINQISEIKKCIKCSKDIPVNELIKTSSGKISYYCSHCFEVRDRTEKKRGKRDRKESSKIYENTPARKESKKMLRKNNPERYYGYCTKYRGKKLNEDPDGYRKRNAEVQAKYRAQHSDKFNKNGLYNTSVKNKYTLYQYYAKIKGYDFKLTKDEFKNLVESDCYYCGCQREKYLNGIDRLNNNEGYNIENTVTACKICNNMKNSLNESTFILMCAHIITYNMLDEFGLYYNVFNDYKGCSYNGYTTRAKEKNLKFDLSQENFNKIRDENPCYICGKYSSGNHKNGIDRVDNNQGYNIENCKSCCGDCNFMKKNISHIKLIMKCSLIANKHKDRLPNLQEIWTPSRFQSVNDNKLSKDEITELQCQRKKERHEKTLSSKTPEAIKEKMEIIKRNRERSKDFDFED
ncbi:hypothetical protein QJ854_gp423 [Moumouvirus goulette]|uniref:Uncharacterized protein n=1 Tax=Moumouvirus goulette TaxID=1247379 RepID=M1PBP3_9VIRU|nr:hypothetical protein QJ854_gp423 [Moumouvirus goulette]AGF85359.1 hypothetical protein glt_00550 [Moumouvirus goulette]